MTTPSLRPPVHGSGTALFIVAIVLMVGAMGGLLYWKFGRTPAEAAPVPSIVTSAAAAPVFEEAPPPPPPPSEPDAGAATAVTKKSAGGSGGCPAECSGQVTAALDGSLRAVARGAQSCYERALRQNTTLEGKVTVRVRVSARGASCGANLVQSSLADSTVASCVLQKFRSASFAPPVGGCVEVQVPISFVAKAP